MDKKTIGYKFKEITFYKETRRLISSFGDSSLSQGHAEILISLLDKPNEIVNKYSFKKIEPNIVEQRVSDIRRILWDVSRHEIIETVRNESGYRLRVECEPIYENERPVSSEVVECKDVGFKGNDKENLNKGNTENIKLRNSQGNEENTELFITENHKVDRFKTFENWLASIWLEVSLSGFIILIVSCFLTKYWLPLDLDNPKVLSIATSISTFIVVALAIAYAIFDYLSSAEIEKENQTLNKYKKDWIALLIFWGFLYLFKTFTTLIDENWLTAITTGLNNLNTLLIFRCFNTLNKSNGQVKNSHNNILVITLLYSIIVFLIAGAEYAEPATYHIPSSIFSGMVAAVAMALYFGRFQSKFLKSPQWLLYLLYFYVAIQPLYLYFEKPEYSRIIIPIALILKCLLILYMFWLFNSGRLLYYLVRVRRTDEEVEQEFQSKVFVKKTS